MRRDKINRVLALWNLAREVGGYEAENARRMAEKVRREWAISLWEIERWRWNQSVQAPAPAATDYEFPEPLSYAVGMIYEIRPTYSLETRRPIFSGRAGDVYMANVKYAKAQSHVFERARATDPEAIGRFWDDPESDAIVESWGMGIARGLSQAIRMLRRGNVAVREGEAGLPDLRPGPLPDAVHVQSVADPGAGGGGGGDAGGGGGDDEPTREDMNEALEDLVIPRLFNRAIREGKEITEDLLGA